MASKTPPPERDRLHVAALDVRTRAWRLDGPGAAAGEGIDSCVAAVEHAMMLGPVALGFGAPLCAPVREEALDALHGPDAAAVALAMAEAASVVPHTLRRLRAVLHETGSASLDWHHVPTEPGQLLLWAFSGDDLEAVSSEARRRLTASGNGHLAIEDCLSVIGASLLHTGWARDVGLLTQPCLTIDGMLVPRRKPAAQKPAAVAATLDA